MVKRFGLLAACLFWVTSLHAAPLVHVDPSILGPDAKGEAYGPRLKVLDPQRRVWIASTTLSVSPRAHDFPRGRLSFWIQPLTDAGASLIDGGDLDKPYPTLRVGLTSKGAVYANHLSWHRKSTWLTGVKSTDGIVRPERWHHVAYCWGKKGQRLFIDGNLVAAQEKETFSISFLYHMRFNGAAVMYADIRIEAGEPDRVVRPDAPDIDYKGYLSDPQLRLLAQIKQLDQTSMKLQALEAKLGPMPYERAKFQIVKYFAHSLMSWALGDSVTAAQEPDIHLVQRQDLDWLLPSGAALDERLSAIDDGRIVPMKSPAITPLVDRITAKDGAFRQDGRPVYLIGSQSPNYGLLTGTGLTITGHQLGPAWTIPQEGVIRDTSAGQPAQAARAREAGMFWDMLYAGHVVPGWFTKKHGSIGVGFMHYDILSPAGWALNETTLRACLPNMSGIDNFLCFDLANEPAFNGNTEGAAEAWRKWLQQRHGTIGQLNAAWKSDYESWQEIQVPVFVNTKWMQPWNQTFPTEPVDLPVYVDWTRFNCNRVNEGYFRRIHDLAKEYLPKTLTYTKMVASPDVNARMGIDVIDNVRTTDISGSDAWWVYQGSDRMIVGGADRMTGGNGADRPFAVNWQGSLMHYDLLRSARPEVPIANAEDHLFADSLKLRSKENPNVAPGHVDMPIPAEHFYSGLWQQCLHGKGLSIIWTHWPRNNVIQRAVAFDACSRAALDLNRLSQEMHALATVRPRVALLYSSSSIAWKPNNTWGRLMSVWQSLQLNGVPVSFVLERDLAAGKLPQVDVLIVHASPQVDADAVATLGLAVRQRGLKIWKISDDDASLAFDTYNRPQPASPTVAHILNADRFRRQPVVTMRAALADAGLLPPVDLMVGSQLSTRIEYRVALLGDRTLVNLCNYSSAKAVVKLVTSSAPPVHAVDLISQERLSPDNFVVASQQVRLIELR